MTNRPTPTTPTIIKALDYITKNEQGRKRWTVGFTLTGAIVALWSGITSFNEAGSWIQNFLPSISFIVGLLCVFQLGRRKNSGNVLGLIANSLEMIINIAFGAFGFVISTTYFFISHVIGFFDWRNHTDDTGHANIEKLNTSRDFIVLAVMIFLSSAYLVLAFFMGWVDLTTGPFFIIANIIAMYVGILAQGLMIFRYRISWILWIVLNLFAIPVQFLSGNFVFGCMYILYQINALLTAYAQYTTKTIAKKEH
ncbi:MAG: nicotinamide riboside transporter PnuC [Culicoidibacterales bacterium]